MLPKQLIDLSEALDLDNYEKSLDRWLEMPIHKSCIGERAKCFDQYLTILKPKVHKYHSLTSLNPNQYGFFTRVLTQEQLTIVKFTYQQLSKFEIISSQKIETINKNQLYSLYPSQLLQKLLPQPPPQLFRIILDEQPTNLELPAWGSHIEIERVSFESRVIHGKGIAKKSLGFPTANLEVGGEIEEKLNGYPNGVYLVRFVFVGRESYFGVCSVGSNPHYEDDPNHRLVEVYVYHDFGEEEFYGAEISLELLILMRFEGKFETFDCFLQSMHNDIETGRRLAGQLAAKL